MKKIHNLKILWVLVAGLVTACYPEEDEILQAYDTDTDIPVITSVSSSFFDASDFDNAFIQFTVDVDEEIVESITIEETFNGTTVTLDSYNTFPAEVSVSAEQAVSELDGVSLNDLEIGDMFTYEIIVTTKNGNRTRSNSLLNATVACESELSGVYTASTSGQSTDSGPTPDENPIEDYPYEVTLTETSVNGVYTISDFSGGLYDLWYDIYGASGDYPGTIQDVCGSLSFINTSEPFGTNITGTGSVDEDTGVITLSGKNGYDDTWTMVLTPK